MKERGVVDCDDISQREIHLSTLCEDPEDSVRPEFLVLHVYRSTYKGQWLVAR